MSSEHEPKSVHLTFEEVVESATEHALANGGHRPALLLEGNENTIAVELEPRDSADRRLEQMYVIGIGVARTGVVGGLRQAFYIAEAWSSHVEPGQHSAVMPAKDPQRREVLLVMNLRLDDRQARIALLEMQRDEEGVLRQLQDITADITHDAHQPNPLLNALVDGYTQGRASLT